MTVEQEMRGMETDYEESADKSFVEVRSGLPNGRRVVTVPAVEGVTRGTLSKLVALALQAERSARKPKGPRSDAEVAPPSPVADSRR